MDWRKKAGDHDGRVDSVEQRGSRVVVAFSWSDSSNNRDDWAQVLELKDGKVTAMRTTRRGREPHSQRAYVRP